MHRSRPWAPSPSAYGSRPPNRTSIAGSQEPSSWVLIDAAPTHSSPIPGESFVDRHCASVPRVPRVTDFSQFNIMGVALSSCTARTARTSDSGREHRREGPVRQKPGRLFLTTDSVGCIIVTTGLPKTTACVASEVHARNPSFPYI
jgi:hypothetical protein